MQLQILHIMFPYEVKEKERKKETLAPKLNMFEWAKTMGQHTKKKTHHKKVKHERQKETMFNFRKRRIIITTKNSRTRNKFSHIGTKESKKNFVGIQFLTLAFVAFNSFEKIV